MKSARFFVVLLVALALSAVALAQDAGPVQSEEFGVTAVPPAGWEVLSGDDKAVFNFKHRGSQSQIQVIATRLMHADVADIFFETFHKTLTESNFEVVNEEAVSRGGIEGQEVLYQFSHSGVTLEVTVFQFLEDHTAWLVIGYMQDSERENHQNDFVYVIENMSFDEG